MNDFSPIRYQKSSVSLAPHYTLQGIHSPLQAVGKKGTCLCIHGFLDHCFSFLPLWEELERDFHLLAYDLPGHGESSFKSEEAHQYPITDYAADLFKALEQGPELPSGPLFLIGHSLGAAVAGVMGAMRPELFSKLVLIDFIPPLEEKDDAEEEFLSRLRGYSSSLKRRGKVAYYSSREKAELVRVKNGSSPRTASLMAERSLLFEANKGFYWHFDRRLTRPGPHRFTPKQNASLLRSLPMEVLVLEAIHEGPSPFDGMNFHLASLIPHHKHVQMKGGHHLHIDSPDLVAQEIRKHLLSHS